MLQQCCNGNIIARSEEKFNRYFMNNPGNSIYFYTKFSVQHPAVAR